jgi:hypothetical protein
MPVSGHPFVLMDRSVTGESTVDADGHETWYVVSNNFAFFV